MGIYRPSDLSNSALPAPGTLNLEFDFTIVNILERALIGKILFVPKTNPLNKSDAKSTVKFWRDILIIPKITYT
jgi:hypothetical protein